MDERLNRVIDFFEGWELVQLLDISINDIVEAFEDEIEDKLTALEEVMEVYDEDTLPDRFA
jgi:hypothetical protein